MYPAAAPEPLFSRAQDLLRAVAREARYDEGKSLSRSVLPRVTAECAEELLREGWAERVGKCDGLFLSVRGFRHGCALNG